MADEAAERTALSVAEAGRRIGVSRAFLYEEIRAGRLQTVKVGGVG
jgi:excisionase family DNA binding protein